MNFLQIVKLIVSLLPSIIAAIKSIEEAIPGDGKGEQKLVAVRGILESAYKLVPAANSPFDAIWPALQGTIGALVNVFNKTDSFSK